MSTSYLDLSPPLHTPVLSPTALSALRTHGDPAPLLGPHRTLLTTSYLPPEETGPHPLEVLLPHTIHSLTSLEFLGFAPPTALALWERFCALLAADEDGPSYPPPRLLAVVKDHLCAVAPQALERAGAYWPERLGLEPAFAFRVQATGWTREGGWAALRGWVLGLVDMRWRLLCGLDELVRTGDRAVVRSLHPAAVLVDLR
ncbi:hypothetical protein MMC27_008191 [Xylographa pallens]|nr:hypothetical protein [Xylographa pallens]